MGVAEFGGQTSDKEQTMRKHTSRIIPPMTAALLSTGLVLAGCSSPMPPTRTVEGVNTSTTTVSSVEYGTVRSIELVEGREPGIGAGAVIGGVAGAVLGNQVGSGSGRAAATAAGAVGGAVAGHEIEKRRADRNASVRYVIDMDNGDQRSFSYPTDQGLRSGQRVRVVNGVLQAW